MTTPRITVEDSARDPEASIWFAVPAGFVELPLDALLAEPGSPGADRLRTGLTPLVQAVPDGIARQQFVAHLASAQQLLLALREVGTVHCALGVHRDDVGGDEQLLISTFTVSWQKKAWSPRAVAAARAVTADEQYTRIEYLDLPCGPASISEAVRAPAAESGLPQQQLLQIHAHLPHPDGKRLAVLTLSTTAVHHREQYRSLLEQIAEMVSFENPLPAHE